VTQAVRDAGREITAITIPFKSYFCGKWIEHCGWWPGYTMPRVLKRGHFRFAERVHGGVEFTGRELMLPPHPDLAIEHFSYRSIEHYVEKFNRYTSTEAAYLAEQGQPRDWTAAIRAMMRDLWVYYEHNQGFLDGEHGWILSWLAGQYRWLSHAKMMDVGRQGGIGLGETGRHGGPAKAGTPTVPQSLDAVLEVMHGELESLRAQRPQLPLGVVWRSPVWDPSAYQRAVGVAVHRGRGRQRMWHDAPRA